MNLLKTKLTKRYSLIVLIAVLFTLSSIYLITTNVMNSSVQSQIEYRDKLNGRTLSHYLDTKFNTIISDLRLASFYKSDQKHLLYKKEIEKKVSDNPLYLFVQVFDKDGNKLLRVPNIQFPSSIDYQKIKSRLLWSKTPYISNMITLPNGKKTIAIAYPSLDEDFNLQGGTIAFINLEILSNYLQRFKIGDDGVNMIVDRNGTVIAHNNTKYIGKSIRRHPIQVNLGKDRFGLWQGELFGKKMMVSYRPLLLGKLGLAVGETVEQAMAPARSLESILLKGFILVCIITLILTLLGTSKIVKPIVNLMQQVKEYKEKKRTSFHHLKTKDEIEDLSSVLEQMATELTEKERQLFYILESIPYGVITTNQDGTITTFNYGAEKLTHYTKEEALNQSITELPVISQKDKPVLLKTLQEGKAFNEIESYIIDKEGNKRDVRMYMSLFKGASTVPIGSIFVIRDVSEIKKMEDFLKQKERMASVGQLTAGIAHEIKNPINIIQAAAEAAALEVEDDDEPSPETISDFMNDILETSDRMNLLLTDFLQLAKGKNDDSKKETIDLITLLEELFHLLSHKFQNNDISVFTEYTKTKAYITGNKNEITQVFLNLFLNSHQAMTDGGTLYTRVLSSRTNWQIEIMDNGKGIPESKLKWIFNPFYSTKGEGTGLGLSIAHEIIKRHDGEIWVESEPGHQTTFIIQLPKYKE